MAVKTKLTKNLYTKLNPLQVSMIKTQEALLQLIGNKQMFGMNTHKEQMLYQQLWEVLQDSYKRQEQIINPYIKRIFINSKLDKAMRKLGLNLEENAIINNIADRYLSNIFDMSNNFMNYIKDIYSKTKNFVLRQEPIISKQQELFTQTFTEKIGERGLVGFIDKKGKHWQINNYSDMLIRTSTRMAHNYGILYTYEDIDLYKISSHNSRCPICRPLEGRVYSRSGTSNKYPPLANAFGKINKYGSNELSNTYLNIHPNCMHTLIPFKETGLSQEEITNIQNFSSFEKNPPTFDPKSVKQMNEYRNKEKGRIKLNEDFRRYQDLRLKYGNKIPKTFQYYLNNKDKYKGYK